MLITQRAAIIAMQPHRATAAGEADLLLYLLLACHGRVGGPCSLSAAIKKAPQRGACGSAVEAVGDSIAGAPYLPAAVVHDVGVASDQGVGVAVGQVFDVAAFHEAADDECSVDVTAGCQNREDAGNNGFCAGAVEDVHVRVV